MNKKTAQKHTHGSREQSGDCQRGEMKDGSNEGKD